LTAPSLAAIASRFVDEAADWRALSIASRGAPVVKVPDDPTP
jgi:hypothetical protein